jgi:uncharacterized membrane-anchored protein YitT (DUF2179 family)
MKNKALQIIKRYVVITLGCILYSAGVSLFLDVYNLAAGGVTGISIVISQLSGIDTGILIIIINIPIMILGAIFFGKQFAISTIYSTLVSSLLIEAWKYALASYIPFTENILLSALIGGGLFGLGLGLIFRMGSTTGGTDIIVKILRKKFRHIKTGIISMAIDITVVAISAIINRDFELTCYTIISIIAFTLLFDWVLYGGNSAKLVYIITNTACAQTMCNKIIHELDLGATFLDAEGGFTGDNRKIIMCAVKNIFYPKLRDAVRETDPNAFIIVSSAKEIYGEGYQANTPDEL